MRKQLGIAAMQDEGYSLPIANEKTMQKTEFAWWSTPAFIIFLTVSMSVLDALVLYDILDQAMTQAEYMGKIVSFGIALVLNMLPLLIAKFTHQAMYRIKKGAAIWAVAATLSFFLLFSGTVILRFAYQDQYGESSAYHITNEVETGDSEETDTTEDPKGVAVVLLLSIEPLVTSLVNFCLAYISDDELRARIQHLRVRRLELTESESDLRAFLATAEPAELRRSQLLMLDHDWKKAAREEILARCGILKALARTYLAEYLGDPESASYVTASLDEKGGEEEARASVETAAQPEALPHTAHTHIAA
jgi:hypothetical protein